MADERVVVSLAVEGARKFQADFLAAQASIDQLAQKLLATERIRTPQLADGIQQAATAILRLGSSGANVEQLAQAFVNLTSKLEGTRVRTKQLKEDIDSLKTSVTQVSGQDLEGILARTQQRTRRQAIVAAPTPQAANLAADVRPETLAAAAAAAQTLQGRLSSLLSTVRATAAEMLGFSRSTEAASAAMDGASRRSITYLSVLSAIHAASFLATNQTFSLIGSFVTLGAAFGKMGVAAGIAGLALGGLLGLFGVINRAIEQIQTTLISGAQALAGFGAVAVGAAVAAGGFGVKVAADVETQLASVRAFGNATNEQLAQVEKQAGQFARQFGVSAASVVEATSLFARAGGTVEEAIKGATEAIIKLQVASAGELSAAQSAIVLSAALKQFNLTGEQAGHVADVLTAAFQGSALSAIGVQQAFVQAAPGAAALGISIDDLGAAIALIGDRLVKGTITGTAFKQAILDLINPSKAARDIFQQYGISIKDVDGKILPLVDIVGQLNAAFGKMVDAESNVIRQQDAATIAALGGARAFLAFNILTEQGATGLQKYRDALDRVSTQNIVDVLLLPLNKQLEVAQVNLQEVGRAFGGPLLQPIRDATVAAIGFFQGLLGPAELLGQAISVIVTGQGFGELQKNINSLVGNRALAQFFIEVANSARNVADVFRSQIIPAIQDFVTTIAGAIAQASGFGPLTSTFDGVNTAIQRIGSTIAGTIIALGNLIAQMIANEGQGKSLRTTLENLANSLLTHLVVGLTTTVTAMSAAIQVMPVLARVALVTAQAALGLAGAFKEVGLKIIDVKTLIQGVAKSNAISAASKEFGESSEQVKKLRAEFDALFPAAEAEKTALAQAADGAVLLGKDIEQQLSSIQNLETSLKNLGKAPAEALATLRKPMEQLVNELIAEEAKLTGTDALDIVNQGDIDRFVEKAGALKLAARQELGSAGGLLGIFDDLAGEIPNQISNIIAEINQAQREAQARATGGAGAGVAVDPKALEAAQKRIAEAASDVQRRLANLEQDAAQKATNVAKRSIERIGDILEKVTDRVTDIVDTANERISELFRNIEERRADRNALESFRQAQEDRFTIFQRGLDKEEQAEQRSLDHRRTDRQRAAEDEARIKDQEIQDDERVFSRLQDAAQLAFDRIAQAREVAFDRAQQVEATIFQRGLDQQATARQNALELAAAKTPEDRARVLAQQAQAKADTKFRQGQEQQLTQFRQGQEDRKRKFSQDQETQGIAFRQGLEDKALEHRRANELVLLDFRRKAEDRERTIREGEEDAALQRRLDREDIIQARRRTDQKELQTEQDRLENIRNEEQAQRIRDQATKDVGKALREAERQINEVIDSAILSLNEQSTDTEKQIRNILDTLIDLKDNFPPEVFAAIGGQLADSLAEAGGKAEALKARLEAIRAGKLGEIQIQGATAAAQLQLTGQEQLQRLNAPTPSTVPIAVLAAQTLTATNFVLPGGFVNGIAGGVLNALRQADQEGVSLADVSVQPAFQAELQDAILRLSRFLR